MIYPVFYFKHVLKNVQFIRSHLINLSDTRSHLINLSNEYITKEFHLITLKNSLKKDSTKQVNE